MAEFLANRVGKGQALFVVVPGVRMDAEPAQAEGECLEEPVARFPALELKLAIIGKTPERFSNPRKRVHRPPSVTETEESASHARKS